MTTDREPPHHERAQRQRPRAHGRRRPRHAHPLGPARHAGHDRHQVRLRRCAVRRLHRASGRPGHPLLHHADLRRRGQEDHHHRSRDRRQRPRRRGRACRMGQARRGAVRLLPERPDHERDRLPQVAAPRQAAHRRRDRLGHGRQHLPLRHLCPHPRRRGRRRPQPSPEGAAMLPNIDHSELPRALQRLLARGQPTKPPRCRAAAS